jgi:hypothetical protein
MKEKKCITCVYSRVKNFVRSLELQIKPDPKKWDIFVKGTPNHKIVEEIIKPADWETRAKGDPRTFDLYVNNGAVYINVPEMLADQYMDDGIRFMSCHDMITEVSSGGRSAKVAKENQIKANNVVPYDDKDLSVGSRRILKELYPSLIKQLEDLTALTGGNPWKLEMNYKSKQPYQYICG